MTDTQGASGWRPQTPYAINLSDLDLAKIGFLVVLDEQAKTLMLAALKGAAQLDHSAWQVWQRQQSAQISRELLRLASTLDETLLNLCEHTDRLRESTQIKRNMYIQTLWASEETGRASRLELSLNLRMLTSELDSALAEAAQLTFIAKACLRRVAELIDGGSLSGGAESDEGPSFKVGGRWIKL